jgi:hypothetical protein
MAEGIIDDLEPVKVNKEQGQFSAKRSRVRHAIGKLFLELSPIRQRGEVVVMRQMRHLRLGGAQLVRQLLRVDARDEQLPIGFLKASYMIPQLVLQTSILHRNQIGCGRCLGPPWTAF